MPFLGSMLNFFLPIRSCFFFWSALLQHGKGGEVRGQIKGSGVIQYMLDTSQTKQRMWWGWGRVEEKTCDENVKLELDPQARKSMMKSPNQVHDTEIKENSLEKVVQNNGESEINNS